MGASKHIPELNHYEEVAEFWDTHSLADYWEQTQPATFDLAPDVGRQYWVAVDHTVLARVQRISKKRGVSIESVINLLLEQRLQEVGERA